MALRREKAASLDRKQSNFVARLVEILSVSEPVARDLASSESGSSFWINPLKGDAAGTANQLASMGVESKPIDWLSNTFNLLSDKSELAETEPFQEGRVFIQNLSSIIAVDILSPQPGDKLLDLCASPGGKSTRAAALTNNAIDLWANDSIKPRITKMESVFNQFGVMPTHVTAHPGQYIDKFVTETFDQILIDAQCSGEARIDLNRPDSLRFWSEKRIQEMSYLQQKMLVSAWKLLRPGGVLVYSTCTFAPEENESPVDFLLRHRDDATVEKINVPLPNTMAGLSRFRERSFDDRLTNAVRILPGEFNEAFFVCRLRKN